MILATASFWEANAAIVAALEKYNMAGANNMRVTGLGETVELGKYEVAFVVDLSKAVGRKGDPVQRNGKTEERKVDLVATSGGFLQIPAGVGFAVNCNVTRDPDAVHAEEAGTGRKKGRKEPAPSALGLE